MRNGIVHTLTQNARQLPLRSRDADGSTSVHDDTYAYDPVGNVASITDGVSGNRGNRSMTYDALDRLTDTTSPMYGTTGAHYAYDVLDNITHTIAPGRDQADCYDASNRLTLVAQATCGGAPILVTTFDAQGNLATWNAVAYGFDYGNRLRQVSGLESYRYDALGRRVLAWSPSQGNILSMYTQSGQLAFQRNERNGARLLDYVYLGGSLVAKRDQDVVTGAVTVTWQHTDALGSPVATTDAARTVLQRSEYEPYGKLLNRPMEDGPGYTGHVTDAATSLVYMQQRYYDPRVARFWSTDAVTALSGPFNRYWYVNNNPYRFTDPDGRAPQDNWYGFNDQKFRDWVHAEKQLEGRGGAQNYSRSELQKLHQEWKDLGKPRGKGGTSGRGGGMRGAERILLSLDAPKSADFRVPDNLQRGCQRKRTGRY